MTSDMIDFLDIYKNKTINIIDIRSRYIYELSHIPNAINIPYDYLRFGNIFVIFFLLISFMEQ